MTDYPQFTPRYLAELHAERDRLKAREAELVAALEATLKVLDTMTSDDFAHGVDKPARDQARAILAKARNKGD